MLKDDLESRLSALDYEASLRYPGELRFSLVIAGGGALVLLDVISRATFDIDVLAASRELSQLFEKYDLNTQIAAHAQYLQKQLRRLCGEVSAVRELTFQGFLKSYVQSLSAGGGTGVFRLTREAAKDNPRLREPLLLYAFYSDKTELLLRAAVGTPMEAEYAGLLGSFDRRSMTAALEQSSEAVPPAYRKVWTSYLARSRRCQTENEVKALVRKQLLQEQRARGFSTYRLYTDLHLNAGNVNAWLRAGDDTKVGLATAKRVLAYARQL